MRISLFGGSTDYKSFYEKHGSFIIGATINKYAYSIIRYRPPIVGCESMITYSKLEKTKDLNEITNPLIRETLKYYKIQNPIELNLATDIPSRTGLGGSSSCCASLANAVCNLMKLPHNAHTTCADAIKIEREILNEPGGIQDQIWACRGGFNTIAIDPDGTYYINPLPVSNKFLKIFKDSLVMVYSKKQREFSNGSHPDEEKNKLKILDIAGQAYNTFKEEDIKGIGQLLYESWLQKRSTSANISDDSIDGLIDDIMNVGAYGAKLLGNGGGGFVLAICNNRVKKQLKELYKEDVLDFRISKGGIKTTIL